MNTPSAMFSLHMPKSAILMCPSESSITLSNFRSLRLEGIINGSYKGVQGVLFLFFSFFFARRERLHLSDIQIHVFFACFVVTAATFVNNV